MDNRTNLKLIPLHPAEVIDLALEIKEKENCRLATKDDMKFVDTRFWKKLSMRCAVTFEINLN